MSILRKIQVHRTVRSSTAVCLIVTAWISFYAQALRAQCIAIEDQKIVGTAPETGAEFGYAVSHRQDLLVVGEPFRDVGAADAGRVSVYRFSGALGWQLEAELFGQQLPSENFGYSVTTNGLDLIVVGAPQQRSAAGIAHVFRYESGQWVEETQLQAPDGDRDNADQYGVSVALSDVHILVGANGDDEEGDGAGAAYAYRYDESAWVYEQKLFAVGGGMPKANLGTSVALDGSFAFVGSPSSSENGARSGAAHFYSWDGSSWVPWDKIVAPDSEEGDVFAESLDVQGHTLVVGARWEDEGGGAAGASYVFGWNGTVWNYEQKLTASDAAPLAEFGSAIALDGDVLAIGSEQFDQGADGPGAVYVFQRVAGSWVESVKLVASDGESGDALGRGVDVFQGSLAAGASFADTSIAPDAGAVYFLEDALVCEPRTRPPSPKEELYLIDGDPCLCDRVTVYQIALDEQLRTAELSRLADVGYGPGQVPLEGGHIGVSRDGTTMYVVGGDGSSFTLGLYDLVTPGWHEVGVILHEGAPLLGLALAAVSPGGHLVVASGISDSLYVVDLKTAQATQLGVVTDVATGLTVDVHGFDIGFSSSGRLFLGNADGIWELGWRRLAFGVVLARFLGETEAASSTGMAFRFNGRGNMVVSDHSDNQIKELLPNGTCVAAYDLLLDGLPFDHKWGDMSIGRRQ